MFIHRCVCIYIYIYMYREIYVHITICTQIICGCVFATGLAVPDADLLVAAGGHDTLAVGRPPRVGIAIVNNTIINNNTNAKATSCC